MSAHTPGPWAWQYLPSVRGEDWTILSIGGLTVEAPSASMYVSCHQSDQRLFAAAPDLLEALIAVRDRKHTPDLWEMVNAAITKATGAQQ